MKKAIVKVISMFMVIVVLVGLLIACGGGGGIPNGKFVTTDFTVAWSGYSSFEFSGNRMTIGMMGDTFLHESIKYTFKNDTLTFVFDGVTINLPLEVVDKNRIVVGVSEYVRE